jgi:DNA-binding SARP family transcriptional activator
MASLLKVTLFGKFSVQRNCQTIEGMQARKVQELFSYLLIARNHSQPREVICETLWKNRSTSNSKKCLRQALWRLQLALNDVANSHKIYIIAEPSWIQISPSAKLWLDIAEFESVFNSVNNKDPRDLSRSDIDSMEIAVKLYRGDLLEGWYQDWCLFERERFQIMYLMLLDKLVQYSEIHGNYGMGLTYGTEVLRHDHAYERTHRQMMRLYILAGDRTQAIHQYQRCVSALREELDIEPSESTKELYEQIRADTYPSSFSDKKVIERANESVSTLSLMLDRLEHFSDELDQMRYEIKREVTALEGTFSTPK